MAKLLKLRRGTTSQHSSFTGAEGEVTVDTDKETLVVHNGSSAAGFPLARESALTSKADLASPDFTTDITLKAQAPVKFEDDSGGEFVGLKAPTGVTSYTVTLPATAPSNGQVLKATSATALGWSADTALTLLDEDNMATDSATAAASQQSVKAYADTKLPLAGGTLTGTLNGTISTFSGKVTGDSFEMDIGTSNEGYYIKDGSGGDKCSLHYSNSASSGILSGVNRVDYNSGTFLIKAGDEISIEADKDGPVYLRYDNVKKFETASSGVQVYGDVIFEGATDDAHETTLAVTDATADRTITLPNATGTVGLLQEDQNWTGSQRGAINALTSASTITIDMNDGNNHSVTLGHNTTFANPTNQTAGQAGSIFITQDGTGSRTAAWGSNFLWKGGTVPTLSTTAAAVDRIDYIILASTKIHAVATLDIKAAS